VITGSPIDRALRFLRARRLAVWLLLFVSGYSVLGTVVPQASREPDRAVAWARQYAAIEPLVGMLGLHSAFSAPIFLIAMGLLFLSTSACAWERARTSARMFARRPGLTHAEVKRLTERPQLRIPVQGLDASGAADALRAALRGLRLEARVGKRVAEAVGGRWGLAGSPLFHISLALLFLVIGLGQMTRAEGLIGVPVGYTIPDVRAAYGRYESGPLYPPLNSRLVFGATDFTLETPVDGVDRGASAVITLREGGTVTASQRVYPNNPLRYGTLLIHQSAFGLSVPFQVEDASGTVLAAAQPTVDFDATQPSGTTTAVLSMTTADRTEHVVAVTVIADTDAEGVLNRVPSRKRARITVTSAGAATADETLGAGQALTLPNGNLLRLKDVVYYVRLSVVDDWSVYPIYALFVLAGVGLTLAVFVPYRAVRALIVEAEGGLAVHVVTKHARRDPLFAESVDEALRKALGSPEPTPDPKES
jgi:cytochrome c biogenesis protein ResB